MDSLQPFARDTCVIAAALGEGKSLVDRGVDLMDESKHRALGFLKHLEKTLNATLPAAAQMEAWVRLTVAAAKGNEKQKHLNAPEAAFLNGQALPIVFHTIQTTCGLSEEQAKVALLSEYHRTTPEISRRSPIRWERHPFRKVLNASPTEIYRRWKDPDQGGALTQSCPDFSLHDPFPHSILFEGKYFARGSREFAQRELVTNIYQAFFYRGLPRLAAAKGHPDWGYDYACLLAYDASPSGTLATAWTALDARTRHAFWEGANIYVMILGGNQAS
jgi:hypothetical protein